MRVGKKIWEKHRSLNSNLNFRSSVSWEVDLVTSNAVFSSDVATSLTTTPMTVLPSIFERPEVPTGTRRPKRGMIHDRRAVKSK